MSYQVLARKYRPKSFQTLVGQEHVVRALTHALEQQRLHHAYLFTGTRGVGKTTLSRILAKSLNCETGITSTPCGVCDACTAIDAGRFVDYIEMDAASNRGVDEMAQLLEQAVYAPSNARFKVYMIDEVHMLTNHAFNSMLKTLEEPPPHIKFILATTDPQKIPVTVLSRCLQFNLKQMPQPAIIGHLEDILAQEKISFELPALRLLAQGAQGSMRDALSLTDQAIAYAAGTVSLSAVQGMLGALDQTYLISILDALAVQDGAALLAVADQMAERSLSYKAALQDMATLLHQLSIAQLVPEAISADLPEYADLMRLAGVFDAEQIQLFYQIAVHGRNELNLAPDEYAGFSMTLLRMLAFRPLTNDAVKLAEAAAKSNSTVNRDGKRTQTVDVMTSKATPAPVAELGEVEPVSAGSSIKKSPAMAALEALNLGRRGAARSNVNAIPVNTSAVKAPWEELDEISMSSVTAAHTASGVPAEKKTESEVNVSNNSVTSASGKVLSTSTPILIPTPDVPKIAIHGVMQVSGGEWDGNWPKLSAALPLRGVTQQLALQSELVACDGALEVITLKLRVPVITLLASGSVEKLAGVLSAHFTVPVKLETEIGTVRCTAHASSLIERAERQEAAETAIKNDALVQGLMREFEAKIVPGSVKPV